MCFKPCIFTLISPLPHPALPSISTSLLAGNEDIIDLPNEVLNSPMGGMLRPMLEQMTTQVCESLGETSFSGWAYGHIDLCLQTVGGSTRSSAKNLYSFSFYFLIISLLSSSVEKPWSQVSPCSPPWCVPSFLSLRGFSIPAAMLVDFHRVFANSRFRAFRDEKKAHTLFFLSLETRRDSTPGPHTL